MKRIVSLLLVFVLTINTICSNAFAAEEKEIQVQIPCQYIIGMDISEGVIKGYLIEDDIYVAASAIEMLTGYNSYQDDSSVTFVKDKSTSSFSYTLDFEKKKIIRYALSSQTEWNVDVKCLSNGRYVWNLEEILTAMNVKFDVFDNEELLFCTRLPYTVYDAWLTFIDSKELLFSWNEIQMDQENTDSPEKGILSAITSLYVDYNSHFVTDAFIAWWTDDVLSAVEEQYKDAMKEILLCMSQDNNKFLSDDDIVYQVYKQDTKVFDANVTLLNLLNIDKEISTITEGLETEVTKSLGKNTTGSKNIIKNLETVSSIAKVSVTVLDLVNTFNQYKSIEETQRNILKEIFVNFPMYSQAEDTASKHIYNAANHLSQELEDNAVGTTTVICDAVINLFIDYLGGTIGSVSPVFAVVNVMATIAKIIPGLSGVLESNKYKNLGCNTWALLMLSTYNYSYWADAFYNYSFPSEDNMQQLKLVMLFRIMASITARQHFIKSNILQESTVEDMNRKNKDLTNLYFLIQSSVPITAPKDNSSSNIRWSDYKALMQESSDDIFINGDAISLYREAIYKTTETGSWTESMDVNTNMVLKNGNSTTKTKMTMQATVDIEGWNSTDTSSLYMSGFANVSVMNQEIAYTMTWENGTAHYEYTKPEVSSVDLKLAPSYFDFDSLNENMISSATIDGSSITFLVKGDVLTERGISAVNNLLPGVTNLSYGDTTINVTINEETGKIDTLTMSFHAAMTYQGFDAESDYEILYTFS